MSLGKGPMVELDYKLVLETLSDAVIAADQSNHIRYLNPAAERLLGWGKDELVGKPLTALMPERMREAHQKGFNLFIATRQPRIIGRPIRVPALHQDGHEIDIELTLSAFKHQGMDLIVASLRDLRERVELDRQVQAREMVDARETGEQFRSLANSIPQLAWIAEPDGAIHWYNRRWYEYTGTTLEQMEENNGWGWKRVHDPADVQRVMDVFMKAVTSGQPWEDTFRLRRHDGEFRWHLSRAMPVRDTSGQVVRWFGTNTDIQEQKNEEEAAHFLASASAALLESLDPEKTLTKITSLAVPHFADWCSVDLIDGAGILKQLALAHVDPAKVIWAKELNRRYPPDPNAPQGVYQVIRTGKAELYPDIPDEMLVASAQDEEHLRISRELRIKSAMVVPLTSRGRTFGAITFIAAESGRRYTEKDLAAAQALADRAALAVDNARLYNEAQEAIKMRDEFLSVASHELRTPLTPLHLNVQAIQRTARQGKPAEMASEKFNLKLDAIGRQVGRLEKLVSTLLDVSRIGSTGLVVDSEELDLAVLASDVIERFEPVAEDQGIELSLRAEAPVIGRWDRLKLDQILVNLLSNALKFAEGKPVEVTIADDSSAARVIVKDHGIGIPLEDQGRIFGRFERAVSARHYGGLGLGLWLSRQFAQAMGGSIDVKSAPGEGSVFTVVLPKDRPPTEVVEPRPTSH